MNYYTARRLMKKYGNACIVLENGVKMTPAFYWYCVELGILNEND